MSMRGGFYGRYPQNFPGPRPFRGPAPAFMPPATPMITRPPPFDQYLCEEHFVRLPEGDDTTISQSIISRHAELTPNAGEQAAINNLVNKVKQVLEKIIVKPEDFPAAAIEEVREVGSFKKGTMLAKSNIADLVVILKSLPTVESVNALGNKIVEDLKAAESKEVFGCVSREYGCEIAGLQAVVRLLVTILPQNAKLLEPDLHLSEKVLQANMAAIRHARWFEENATQSSVKVLVRILKDMKRRYEGLQGLSIWAIELLSHYCVIHTLDRNPLPLSHAFKRFFMLLSAGLLLPTSPALVDPCDPATRINYNISMENMDSICSTAQTLLRVILHGGIDHVLGLDPKGATITTEMSIWGDVVVTPLEKAYSEADMEPFYRDDQNGMETEVA
uniref:DZF domain-containing protein n=1 Tax=Acrobeloides nanus TaxID=290746 RepID=A0A914D2P7_9BILA